MAGGKERIKWNYPAELPVVAHRAEILAALRKHRVIVVVSDTGSGKTTQLPKMVAEALGDEPGLIGCTQPRRLAAVSVAGRVAEELQCVAGGFVGYQVRFDEKISRGTRVKFMTDGILLAESQGDPELRKYRALILDEAHERSLNIDFLLGYLKRLLETRDDLTVVISSATLDAGSFSAFFAQDEVPAPVIEAPGRLFPVSEFFLPPREDEELAGHVARGVEWLGSVDPQGDVLVFLPGEREIRECADVLEGRGFPGTEILPLYARLGLVDQQRVFHPGGNRRIILATNVAETSLTIPRIACVIDSGVARVSRWSPARGVQRLQIEPVSQASARQRMGRCGRVRDGVCLRLYDETEAAERAEFTDPEIRRSSLAGVILRMKSLGLPDIGKFPLIDPPAPKSVAEGMRALREVGALDRDGNLTADGWAMSQLPVEPRLAKTLLAARAENVLEDLVPVIAALEAGDARERPAEKTREADAAHTKWKDIESDFIGILRLWLDLNELRDGRGNFRRNQLRKFSAANFLNARRVIEWGNVAEELAGVLEREWKLRGLRERVQAARQDRSFAYAAVHRALLAGAPRRFGLWDKENKAYRSAAGGFFAVFPGSGLFGIAKRHEWVMGIDLVETSRLWARRVAKIDPAWIEEIAPHLCRSRFGEAHWDAAQGAVYGKETVVCGGLAIVAGRRVHYGRVDPAAAHEIFLREGILAGGLRKKCRFYDRIEEVREEIHGIEEKLRRGGALWSDDAVLRFLEERVPAEIHTAAAFHRWLADHEDRLMISPADVMDEEIGSLGLEEFPDVATHAGAEFAVYYHEAPGERDDGVTLGVHLDQLSDLPDWFPAWGIDGNLRERAELLLRGLPKDFRRACQPIGPTADSFAELWIGAPKEGPLEGALAAHVREATGALVPEEEIRRVYLPPQLVTKIWICGDDGEEIAMGDDAAALKAALSGTVKKRVETVANEAIERKRMTQWETADLPETIITAGGLAFPALVDEGETAGVRAFSDPAEAAENHRAGLVRLWRLAHPAQVEYMRKKFPLGLMVRVELPRLGASGTRVDELVSLAFERAANVAPRTGSGFSAAAAKMKAGCYDAAAEIGKSLDATLEILPELRQWVEANRRDRNLADIAEDVGEELDWLFRAGFAWKAGHARLVDYPRRLRALRSRLGRVASLPIVKDLEKMQRLRKFWRPWFREWTRNPERPGLWETGWLLGEFRVSLFAPDVPVLGKTSEKILGEALAQLGISEG